jgi:hypothetical protein
LLRPNLRFRSAMHADLILPFHCKPVVARFDGGQRRMAAFRSWRRWSAGWGLRSGWRGASKPPPRAPDQIRHEVAEMIRFGALAHIRPPQDGGRQPITPGGSRPGLNFKYSR